ncbi:MAG: aromatic ring-hydroxylating dioxygenase subunit alpha [Lysobacteraceae bacterium]|nr:MAG: aromatic ring-hydroxylating dioxygenase subunit alpha [Xanthomonadaceae bacterium]
MQLPQNQWYIVLAANELRRKPLGAERLGRRIVFWRDRAGVAHAHGERCPHLGASLSAGTVQGDTLVCPFHGFAFDGAGRCRHIPANGCDGRIPQGMALETWILREAHGFLWLWLGRPRDAYPPLPYFEELGEPGWRCRTDIIDWPVHYTRAIENQLDVAHLAFVHGAAMGQAGRSFVDGPYVESDAAGIRIWSSNRRDTGQAGRSQAELRAAAEGQPARIRFLFPGTWMLHIGPSVRNVVAFVPINEHSTRYYLRFYHRVRVPVLAQLFELALGWSNRLIIGQDRRVVVTQTPASSLDAGSDRFIEADRAIIAFRKVLAGLLAAP